MTARPDFVMVGGQSDGRFYLIASKTLSDVEFGYEVERVRSLNSLRTQTVRSWHTIEAEMRDVTMVTGGSYAECFQTLFAEWSPEPERRELDELRAVTQRARNVGYHELGIEPEPPGPLALT